MKAGYKFIVTQRDNKGEAIAFIMVWIDSKGNEHPRKP